MMLLDRLWYAKGDRGRTKLTTDFLSSVRRPRRFEKRGALCDGFSSALGAIVSLVSSIVTHPGVAGTLG